MDQLEEKSIFNLELAEDTKTNLRGLTQWLNISAIVGFISLGVTILSAIYTLINASKYGTTGTSSLFSTFISGGISLWINLTLYNAAKSINTGIANEDQGVFGYGLSRLATYFKIIGIIAIILLIIFALALLIVAVAGVAGGFR